MMVWMLDVPPAEVLAFLRLIMDTKSWTVDRLENLLHPPSVRQSGSTSRVPSLIEFATYYRWIQYDPESQRYERHSDLSMADSWTEATLHKQLQQRLLGKSDMIGQDLFPRWVAWYLDQPLQRLSTSTGDLEHRWQEIAPEAQPVFSEKRWLVFLEWTRALGLLERWNLQIRDKAEVLVVNPTPFLRNHLPDWMPQREPMSALIWQRTLAEQFPVFDGGTVRQAIREREDRILSPSLSLALKQLSDQNLLQLEDRKDADRLRLRVGRTEQQFTHITWLGGNLR